MKKLYLLLLLTLSLSPYVVLPTAVVAETHITQSEISEELDLPPIELEPVIPQMAAVPINAFNGLSLSAFATAAGGGTLSAGLLSGAASAILAPAILGIGLGYSFYQLGQVLGTSSADLAKTNQNLSHYFASSADARQELNHFIRSGVDSTTNTYDFSESLQSYYAQNNLGHTIMSEFLTGTSDHGVYLFNRTTATWQSKYINYNVRWSRELENCIIVRDTSITESPAHESAFIVLESFRMRETSRGSSQTVLSIHGEKRFADTPDRGPVYGHEIIWDIPMDTLLEQLTTPEEFLTFIRQNTPYEFGSIEVPSLEAARRTASAMSRAFLTRHESAVTNLTQLIASEEGMQFDPSGLVARLNGRPVTATTSGNFIYADNQTSVPTDLWHSIEFIYDPQAIPHDDAITIDGKRGVFDPATGHIIDVNGNILIAYTLGAAWTIRNYNAYANTVSKWEEDDSKWYTPLDFIYDELFTRGHTIRDHVGKDKKFLEERLKKENIDEATTFYEPITPLIMINAAILSAKHYLNGTIAGIPGVDSTTSPLGVAKVDQNNKIVFTSKKGLLSGIPTGWGIERVDGGNKIHSEIPDTLVTIQRKSKQVRKNRYYFILTAYPDIRTDTEH